MTELILDRLTTANPAERASLIHVLYQTMPNNWLKIHGMPLRRKPKGSRKTKKFFYVDEMYFLFQPRNAQAWMKDTLSRARR